MATFRILSAAGFLLVLTAATGIAYADASPPTVGAEAVSPGDRAAVRDGSARFVGLRAGERMRFEASLAGGPTALRRLAADLDGLLVVRRGGCPVRGHSCAGSTDGQAWIRMHPAHLRGPATGFVVTHEFAHVVDLVVLDAEADRAFTRLFRRSPAWRDCFPHGGRCLPPAEIFAEQFAHWATGRSSTLSAYAVPRLAEAGAFGRLLAREHARWLAG